MAISVISGCELVGDPDVRPLPPVNRPSAEARAGLPEVGGRWFFAGWALPDSDTAVAPATFASIGDLVLTQRLDSVAGRYGAEGATIPIVGEVRRGGTISLVSNDDARPREFLAGRVADDTLWLELTSLAPSATWPAGTRAAFLREHVGDPFVQLGDGTLFDLTPPTDSAASDSIGVADSTTPTPPERVSGFDHMVLLDSEDGVDPHGRPVPGPRCTDVLAPRSAVTGLPGADR